MNPYIYLRTLKHAEHTVFCVADGQKFYYDPQFGTKMAYSSGQQVKRCILEEVMTKLNKPMAPITFNYEMKSKNTNSTLEYKQTWAPCDPANYDQLLGGWMKATTGEITFKRRSPFSISAMRPLHPLLGGMDEENITFDRSSNPDHHPVIVRDSQGVELSKEKIDEFLTSNNRTLSRRIWIPNNKRTSGLYIFDTAIDMRTLFCVSSNEHEPEIPKEMKEKLKSANWVESENAFGKCLVLPEKERNEVIPAIAHALLNWKITSNQARTFSLMETLAVSVSENANKIAGSIRAVLSEETERPTAKPILDGKAGANLFIALPAEGYIAGVNGNADAIDNAENLLIEMLKSFNYENQI